MSAQSSTAKPGRLLFPGPGIVVTSAHIETFEGYYRIRDLIIEDPCYYYRSPANRRPRRMILTAWYRGRRVVLFASSNRRVFEQVRRAIVRAQEANRRPVP